MSGPERPFRFGLVAGRVADAAVWSDTARRAEQAGYSTLLAPDSMQTLAPWPALAAAATATRTLRLGSYVLAAPFHTAGAVAWHAASLDLLSGGRFELGLGAGRPGAEQDAARLGLQFGSPGQRVEQLAELIKGVKAELAGEMYPRPDTPLPVMIAGSGRRMLTLAAAEADIVAFGMPPQASEDDLAGKVTTLRGAAGERADDIELALSLHGVGNEIPDWLSRNFGMDVPALIAAGAVSLLTGSPREMADRLLRRRERTGVSYVVTNSMFLEPLAGVIELLDGQ